jgi:hypothetical protein
MRNMKWDVVRVVVLVGGVFYTLTGLALLLAPQWFFDNIGTFPPFNRHYEGDLGSFLLALGLALIVAARDPLRHRLLIACAAAGSLLHAANHIYDDLVAGSALPDGWWAQAIGLVGFGLLLALVYFRAARMKLEEDSA